MYFLRKLKPDRNVAKFIPPLVIWTLFIITLIFFGLNAAIRVIGFGMVVISIFSIIGFLRTSNFGHLVSALYMVSISIFVITLPVEYLNSGGKLPPYSQLNAFISIFLLVWIVILLFTRKIKWRGREVFELAAFNIEDVSDGYTSRPHPSGKIDGTKTQILQFAEFLKKNLVILTYIEQSRVIMSPIIQGKEHGFLYQPNFDYLSKSWISFDFEGNVAVNISREDYLNYQENLSFDQLCEGMGKVFIDFFEMYKKGEGIRVIDKLNSLKIGIFS